MNSLALLLAPIALLLPNLAGQGGVQSEPNVGQDSIGAMDDDPFSALGFSPTPEAPLRILDEARKPAPRGQVRIEQRVIIRISPSSAEMRRRMLASLPRRESRTDFQEIRQDDCIEVGDIAGSTTAENRLLLFMSDRRVLTLALDEACTARAFYSGFYVERSSDGKLCVSREKLQSRAGASCEIRAISRLVSVRN